MLPYTLPATMRKEALACWLTFMRAGSLMRDYSKALPGRRDRAVRECQC